MTTARGLYVHFPFCLHRCPYCDFVLTTARVPPSEAYTDAVLAELAHRSAHEWGGPLASLYLGGGTPSLWDPRALARFMAVVGPRLEAEAECTIEANPEQVDDAWLAAMCALGLNRVSLGVQSLDPEALDLLGRGHGRQGAKRALDRLAEAHARGLLASFSVDLMYGWRRADGVPQRVEELLAEASEVVERWRPPHLSCYALTVEPKTVLGRRVRDGKAAAPDDGLQAEMMFALRDHLARQGYLHYEVSSFAASPSAIAAHNARYWDMTPWVGLGAGAAGFTGARRYRNQPIIRRYLAAAPDDTEAESEPLGADDLAFDAVMTGLRRLDIGVAWTAPLAARFEEPVARAIEEGRLALVELDGALRLRVTDSGLRYLDDVLTDILAVLDPT
jgi:putative oxygen-independent coproporphyrinogen III oxidase